MNEIINKFLLAGDKCMSEMHLRQFGFRYSACGPFTKKKERIKKFKETGDSRYIYQNELDKACFENDVACGDFKDLNRRTAVDKVSRDKTFNIAKTQNTMDINVDVLQWSINFSTKKLVVMVLKMRIIFKQTVS